MTLFAPQLAQAPGKKLLAFQLPELQYSTYHAAIPQRKTPIWMLEPTARKRAWIISLPAEFAPEHIPNATGFKQDSTEYSLKIAHNAASQTLVAEENSIITDRLIPAADYPSFRAGVFTRAGAAKTWLIMKK